MLKHNGEPSPTPEPAASYTFDRFRINVGARELWHADQAIPLPPKAFDALVLLVTHHDRVVTKDELMARIWPDSFVSEDSIIQIISMVRRALGDDPAQPKFVTTVSRRGYRFIKSVTEITNHDDAPSPSTTLTTETPDGTAHHREASPAPPPAPRWPGGRRVQWGGVAVGVLLTLVAVFVVRRTWPVVSTSPAPARSFRFIQDLSSGTTLVSGGVLSPDGRYLAFVAHDDRSGKTELWLRQLDSPEARALKGTVGASSPFWSPDSRSIAFFSGTKLKRVGLGAEAVRTITSTMGVRFSGGSWAASGTILYGESGTLYSVEASGGAPTIVRAPDVSAEEVAYRRPELLPDGQHYLYAVTSTHPERSGTYLSVLGSRERTRLLDASNASYAPGYLVYVRERALLAQPFDASHLTLAGAPFTMTGNVLPNTTISASSSGDLLAFGGGGPVERLVWFDRAGRRLGTIDVPAVLHNLALSPTERQLLGSSAEPGQEGTWLIDLDRSVATRLVSRGGAPLWSNDGSRIAYTSPRVDNASGIYVRSSAGHDAELLLSLTEPGILSDWSHDGRYVVYMLVSRRKKMDLWLLPRFGDRKPIAFLQTPFNQIQPKVSPDGRWIAYASDESGRWEVYLQSFPTPGVKLTISSGGGTEPQWRSDGKELFYLSSASTLTAVDMRDIRSSAIGRPQALFAVPILGNPIEYRGRYAVSTDGKRFLVASIDTGNNQDPITVLINWRAALKP